MKLVHKIILANTLGIVSIISVAAFSYHEFNLLSAKLRFVEIADRLKASFLEMRLSEKNYFLYKDQSALPLIKNRIQESHMIIRDMESNIVNAIGYDNFNKLNLNLDRYEKTIEGVKKAVDQSRDVTTMETMVREDGRVLRVFSDQIVQIERQEVNDIIVASRSTLIIFFASVIVAAILSCYLFFSKMFKNLRRIEKTANSISKGNFVKIEGKIQNNELGSAMSAINSMCEELKTGHEQLVQSRKLASLGTLTAGVAHELGNPLNNISMTAQTFLELVDHLTRDEIVDYMNKVLEESERIRRIVQDLLDFSRIKKGDFKVSDINKTLISSLKLVQNMFNVSGIKINLNLQDNLPPVYIDENKIREVVVNLLTNAIHATCCGDHVYLRTSYSKSEDRIRVEIEDTGKGIPHEFRQNIFDPFFSTKGTEGTGLGLSISYGVVKEHKGSINVKSDVGMGTTFTIELPVYKSKEDTDEQT